MNATRANMGPRRSMAEMVVAAMFALAAPVETRHGNAARMVVGVRHPREGEIIHRVREFYAQRPRPWRWKGARK